MLPERKTRMICSWSGVSVMKSQGQIEMGAGMTEYEVIWLDPHMKGSHTSTWIHRTSPLTQNATTVMGALVSSKHDAI